MQSACMANSSSLLPPTVLPPLSATTETWVESATADIQRQAVSFACPSGLLRVPTTGSNLLRDDVQLAELFAASKWPPGLQATSETSFQVQPDLANLILVANERNRVVLVRGKRFHNGSHRLRRGIPLHTKMYVQ